MRRLLLLSALTLCYSSCSELGLPSHKSRYALSLDEETRDLVEMHSGDHSQTYVLIRPDQKDAEARAVISDLEESARSAAGEVAKLWPVSSNDGYYHILYYIDPSFTAERRNLIVASFKEWEQGTLLRFAPIASSKVNAGISYIRVMKSAKNGCNSGRGMFDTYPTSIRLGPTCDKISIMHEIGHAIGLTHEHQKPHNAVCLLNLSALKRIKAHFLEHTYRMVINALAVDSGLIKGHEMAFTNKPFDVQSIMI